MLYKGTTPAALYRGAYRPGRLYKGTQLVAGYEDVSKAAPASWDGTYADVVGVAAQGRGKQQTYSGRNLLDDAAMRTYSNWRDDLPGTTGVNMGFVIATEPGTYTLSWTQPEDGSFPDFFYVYVVDVVDADGGFDYFYLTTNTVVNLSYTITVPAGGYAYVRMTGIGSERGFRDAIAKIATIQLERGGTPTAYEPYVGGQPSPSPDYPQPLVAAEGALTASGWTGTTPTTVTLPVLRAIPGTDIRDTLVYIGGGQWQVTRSVGVIDSYAGESVGSTWASSTGQLITGAVVWYALATPTTETVTLGELPSYPVHTALAVSGDYPPDVTGTVKVSL